MRAASTIPELLDALEASGPGAATAFLPDGEEGSALISRAADEAESRIMADLSRAVRTTAALVELADLKGDHGARARARRVHGQALTYSNQYERAGEVLRESLGLAGGGVDPVEEGRALLTLLHVFARQTRFDDAAACGLRARDAFRAAGERVLMGRAENNLGILERMRDRPANAISHFEEAAGALAEQPALLAHVENNRAEALLDLDRFSQAEDAFGSALSAFRQSGAARHAAIVLGNLADLTARQGRFHEALALFEEARRALGEGAAPGDAARLAVEQADVLVSVGMLSQAASAYRDAIPVLAQHSMSAEAARARLGLGRAMAGLGEPGAAAELAAAESMFAALGNSSARGRALAAAADCAAAGGDLGLAMSSLEAASEAVRDRPAAAAWIDLLTARILLERGECDKADSVSARASGVAEQLHLTPLAADLLHVRGRALRKAGRLGDAVVSLRAAVERAERCRGTLQTDFFRAAFLAERASIWEDAAATVLDAGGEIDEAFGLIEMARSRSLLDVLTCAPAGGPGDDPEDLVGELARSTAELNALYARTWDAPEKVRERLAQEIERREARAQAILIRLGAASRFGGSFARPTPLKEIMAGVPGDGVLLEFFAEGGELSAFVITRDGVRVRRRFGSMAAIGEQLEALRFQVGRALARGLPGGRRGAELAADAGSVLGVLGKSILGDLGADLESRGRIAVIPTGLLHQAPFAALGMGGRPLLEMADVRVGPSASVLANLPEQAGGPTLAVGVADEAAPHAEQEAHGVGAAARGARVLAGVEATRAAFAGACRGAGHVHFAGHARFIATNPGASGLKLADGWLTAAEISRLDLGGASVLLSGCDTGRAMITRGDEQAGLARSVLAAGASSVTTTLWPVHDQTTWAMMTSVYRQVHDAEREGRCGVSLCPAIRAAQQELARGGAHPAAWAGFQNAGSPWQT